MRSRIIWAGLNMELSFWGHNCFLITAGDTAVLTDPWFSTKGAYFSSWYQWPLNHDKLTDLMSAIEHKRTHIYISHEHQDHFDLDTLEQLKAHCDQVIVPEYYDKFLFNAVVNAGYDVTELSDSEEVLLGDGIMLKPMIVDTGTNHDSAVVIRIGDEIFLNQNDCKIHDRIKSINDPITYYAVQFSGANWHPECYQYAPDQKADISRKKIRSKIMGLKNTIRALAPKYLLPSAGPAIFPFFDPDLSLGDGNIFIHQPEFAKHLGGLEAETVYLRPGEHFRGQATTPIEPPTREHLQSLANTLPNVWADTQVAFDPAQLLAAVRNRLRELNGLTFETCPQLIFRWGGSKDEGISIDLNTCEAQISNTIADPEFYYCLQAEPKYFALMSDETVRWQDVALCFHASLDRKPDLFNTFVNLFLYSDVSNIRKSFTTTLSISEERIVRYDERTGKAYEFHRYCPHNGADLIDAPIDESGHIICPRHAWRFDLANGGLCAENSASIDALEVENTITLCETISTRLVKTLEPVARAHGSSQDREAKKTA